MSREATDSQGEDESREGYKTKRRNFVLDAGTNEKLASLAEAHHNGNESEALRAAVHFRHQWGDEARSLPRELMEILTRMESQFRDLNQLVEEHQSRLDEVDETAATGLDDDAQEAREKRKVLRAIPADEPVEIREIADQVGLQVWSVQWLVRKLHDKGKVIRTSDDSQKVMIRRSR